MCFSYETKKKLRNVVVGLFFLFGGIEYGVIIPTLWLYMHQTFNATESFYSVVLSSYSFASLITSPLFGAWIDFRKTTKFSLMVGLLFQIGGNFLYFVAPTKELLLAARLLSGVGDGVGSVLFAQVVRTSSVEERTAVLSMAMGAAQIGTVVGPTMNFALKECNFHIGPFLVNNYTSPGLAMAIIWTLVQILVITCYYDFTKAVAPNITSEFDSSVPSDSETLIDGSGNIQGRDALPVFKQRRSSVAATVSLWKELLNPEVIVILMTQFITFFNTSSLEALIAPMMERLLGWKETKNSLLYTLIGVQAILVYILVNKLSKRITDRWLIVFGLVVETAAIILYLVVLAPVKPYDPIIIPTISVGTFLIVLGIPFIGVGGVSLYSKITSERRQGFMQGVRRSILRIAMIMGSLWGGSLSRRLYILLSVSMGLVVFVEVMMFLSFNRLVDRVRTPVHDQETEEEEMQPLDS